MSHGTVLSHCTFSQGTLTQAIIIPGHTDTFPASVGVSLPCDAGTRGSWYKQGAVPERPPSRRHHGTFIYTGADDATHAAARTTRVL